MKALKLLAAVLLAAPAAFAQGDYPNKPLKIVVPFTAGSATDIVARVVGEAMGRSMGQPFVIENRGGAGGTVGATMVAKSSGDGYTLLVHSAGHAANAALYAGLAYDTTRDFSCVSTLAHLPNVLVAAPAKYKSVKDLVDRAKAEPGKMNYASAGVGSATHMNAEIFRQSAKFDAVHVPFKGTPEALTEVMTGRVDYFFAPLTSALPQIKEGKVQSLAVGTAQRSSLLPDVPTTLEAGYAKSDYIFWLAMLVPSGTPKPIVDRLNAEALKALGSQEVKDKLASLGAEAMPMGTAACDNYLKAEVARMGAVINEAGIKAQ